MAKMLSATRFAVWLARRGLSLTGFARLRPGRATKTIQRYARGERVPHGRREALELCVDTAGAIQPNSWYGLPEADEAAALAAARLALGPDGCTPAAAAERVA